MLEDVHAARPHLVWKVSPDKAGEAIFSPCGAYRYALARETTVPGGPTRACLFVMLNPSTATEEKFDPSVRRCLDYATRWGYGRLYVGNFGAYRSTSPEVFRAQKDPYGPDNDAVLDLLVRKSAYVVVAWGGNALELDPARASALAERLAKSVRVFALKRNKDGSPVHPLYQPKLITPVEFR